MGIWRDSLIEIQSISEIDSIGGGEIQYRRINFSSN